MNGTNKGNEFEDDDRNWAQKLVKTGRAELYRLLHAEYYTYAYPHKYEISNSGWPMHILKIKNLLTISVTNTNQPIKIDTFSFGFPIYYEGFYNQWKWTQKNKNDENSIKEIQLVNHSIFYNTHTNEWRGGGQIPSLLPLKNFSSIIGDYETLKKNDQINFQQYFNLNINEKKQIFKDLNNDVFTRIMGIFLNSKYGYKQDNIKYRKLSEAAARSQDFNSGSF